MRDKYYIWGLALLLLGGGALADHITDNVGSGPISTFVFCLGFVLICMSYGKEK
jgi:hypothetical protein